MAAAARTICSTPHEDALKLAEVLQREGVLNSASVVLTNAQATVGGVRSAFARVAAQAGPDDMFLFFFSGHGDQNDTAISRFEPDGRSEFIVLRDGQSFFDDVEMSRLFGTLNTRLALLVLDSCYSGGFARNVVDRPGVMGLFSSEEDLTVPWPQNSAAGGYLSHFLRTGMAGAADGDGDRLVTAGELADLSAPPVPYGGRERRGRDRRRPAQLPEPGHRPGRRTGRRRHPAADDGGRALRPGTGAGTGGPVAPRKPAVQGSIKACSVAAMRSIMRSHSSGVRLKPPVTSRLMAMPMIRLAARRALMAPSGPPTHSENGP